ncbi:MAG: TIGR02597 family protein [Verrucomicrobiae bacterium]|nr:TIGR02597 family protein [Verrucomicrobiae bacterium]
MDRWAGLAVFAVVLLLSVSGPSARAVDVYTDPVGFITLTIRGTNGAPPGTTSVLSYLGLGLTQLVVKQGRITGAASNELVDALASWSDDQYNGASGPHFIEITSGPYAGLVDDIVKTVGATKKIYTANNLASLGLANITNQTYRIRKHWTIASVFGPTNQAGLQGGTSAAMADNVLVPDQSGALVTYWYKTGGFPPGTGWRKGANASIDVANDPIYFGDGVVVRRRVGPSVTVKLLGAVKLGRSILPLSQGDTFMSNPFAANLTLNTSGLYTTNVATGLKGGNSAGNADNVLLPTGPNGTLEIYWFKDSGFPPGTGWRKGADAVTNVGTTPLGIAQGFVVRRKAPNAAFDWYTQPPY